jgi:hypothetical protein
MEENRVVDSPYKHSNTAQQLEQAHDVRRAEVEYKAAVKAADKLPLHLYKQHFSSRKAHEQATKQSAEDFHEEQMVTSLDELERSYQELLALPFLTRVQLAGFYARHNALPEARDVCEEAIKIGLDEISSQNKSLRSMHERASDLLLSLTDIIGPSNVEEVFEKTFDKLDKNKDGFVDEQELKRAQLDLSINEEAQHVIRYLLYHYFDVENASNDEWGMEISGITKRDVKKYQKHTNADWKRMDGD